MFTLTGLLIAGLGFLAFLIVTALCIVVDHWMRRVATRRCSPAWREVPPWPKRRWRAGRETAWRN
jgi:hypothetical protein